MEIHSPTTDILLRFQPPDYQQNNFFQHHLETLIKMAHPLATMFLKYTTTTAIPVTMDQLPITSPVSMTFSSSTSYN